MDDIIDEDIVEEIRERSKIKTSSPTQTALNKLGKALSSYSEVDNDLKKRLVEEMRAIQNIRFYNMDILASTLVLLIRMDNDISPESFNEEIDSVFYKFPTVVGEEARQALRENILRYVYSIATLRGG